MGKNEEKERKIEENETFSKLEQVTVPIGQEYGKAIKDVLEIIDKSYVSALSAIGKDTRSIFSNKRTLRYIANLVELAHWSARLSLLAYFSSDFLNRKVEMLEEVIVILSRQLKDMPAPEDIKKLRELATTKTEIEALMKKLKEMTDQSEKEKVDTFRKIDRARQQVMKDIV